VIDLTGDIAVQYHMNESSWVPDTACIIDSSGHARHATPKNDADTQNIHVKLGAYAGEFDSGADDKIITPYTPPVGDFSMEFWGRIENSIESVYHSFFTTVETTTNRDGILFHHHITAGLRAVVYKANSGILVAQEDSVTCVEDTWYHLIVVYNHGGGSNSTLKVYKNTVEVADDSDVLALAAHDGVLEIGIAYKALAPAWWGQVDEFRVYEKVLSSAERTWLYNGGLGRENLSGIPIAQRYYRNLRVA